MNKPNVSIVIPVYNGANFLREAIDSAIAQTYRNTEVIVVNDGSSDAGETESIALSYGDKIRYFYKENGGVASALNMGIREMRGDYFAWLSHDDVFYPDKIASQMSVFDSNEIPPDSILYGDFDIINTQCNIIGHMDIVPPELEHLRFALMVRHPIHGCTTLIPRLCFLQGGLFNERLRTTQDYELWFRFAGLFRFVHQPIRLIQSRNHEAQGTKVLTSIHLLEVNELLTKFVCEISHKELIGGYGDSLPYAYAYVAENFYSRKFFRAARQSMKYSFQFLESLPWRLKWRLIIHLCSIGTKLTLRSIIK